MQSNRSLGNSSYEKYCNVKYLYQNENLHFYDDSDDDIENTVRYNLSKRPSRNPSSVFILNTKDPNYMQNESSNKADFKFGVHQEINFKNLPSASSSKTLRVPVFSLVTKPKKSYKSLFTNCDSPINHAACPGMPYYGKPIISKHPKKINVSTNHNYWKYRKIINAILEETLKNEKYYRNVCKALKAALGELEIKSIKSNQCNSSVCKKILEDCLHKYTSTNIRTLCLCMNCKQKNVQRKFQNNQIIQTQVNNPIEKSIQTEESLLNRGTQTFFKKIIYPETLHTVNQETQSTQTSNLLNIKKVMFMKNDESENNSSPKTLMYTNIKGVILKTKDLKHLHVLKYGNDKLLIKSKSAVHLL